MKWYGVCPSVCLSIFHSSKVCCCGQASSCCGIWFGQASRRYRSIAAQHTGVQCAAVSNAGSATLSLYVVAQHTLVDGVCVLLNVSNRILVLQMIPSN